MASSRTTQMYSSLLAAAVAQALFAVPAMADTAAAPAEAAAESNGAAADAAQAAPGQSKADPEKTQVLGEMVVTAQRRSQKLQDVPISVTAIDSRQIESRGLNDVSDLSGVAPNLTIIKAPGTATSGVIAIRGSVRVNPALFWDTPVGMYLDGVYLGKTAGNVFDLLNVERIEVLRGPQGTLFGRNTMAGAVNIVTREPSGEFVGEASLGFGNFSGRVAKAIVDLPAFGGLKATVGGRIERQNGWVDTTPGSSVSQLNNRRNGEDFLALQYDVTDSLKLSYRYDHTEVSQASMYFQPINSNVKDIFKIPGIVVKQGRQTRASVDAPAYETLDVDGNTLTAAWNLGDAGTIKFIGGHREMDWTNGLELDGSPIPFAQASTQSNFRQTSGELQYLGSVGRWNWVAGLYYFRDKGFAYNPQSYFFGQSSFDARYGFSTKSRAAYAQVDYALTDALTLTVGLRRTEDDKSTYRYLKLLSRSLVLIPGVSAKASFSATTPAFNLNYKLTDSNSVYVRYAKGYMGGGFNGDAQTVASATTPFLPQTQQSYEIGSKNTFLGGKLSVNAAAFYNKVDNLQQSVISAQNTVGSVVLNVGRSHNYGFEIETQWRPVQDLTLGLNYGYLKGAYDSFVVNGVDVSNNRSLQFLPRNTVNLTADYTLARTEKGRLHANFDYRFTSKYYLYTLPLTSPTPAMLAGNAVVKGYGLLNGRIALSDIPLGERAYGEVAFWVKNLADKAHIDNIVDFGPGFGNLRVANYNEPRSFGINVGVKW